MSDLFQNAPPYIQALIAGIITWLLTALGAAAVFISVSYTHLTLPTIYSV